MKPQPVADLTAGRWLWRRPGAGGGIGFAIGLAALLAQWLFSGASFGQPAVLPINGNFERADLRDKTKPLGWDRPDGLGVQWTQAPDAAHGKAIRMDTRVSEQALQAQWVQSGLTNLWNIPKPGKNAIAETYGLSLYSDAMPVKPGQAYRITFDYRGPDGGAKVWVRGWGLIQGQKRRRWETTVTCHSSGEGWNTVSQLFHPTKHRPEVTEMRVMLFAFYPPGVYWFDNVRIEPVAQ